MTPIHIFLSVFTAFVLAEVIKAIGKYVRTGTMHFFGDGGMPSGHGTTVSALATAMYVSEGFSPLFIITLVFASIVIYDSINSRRQIGLLAAELNKKSKKKLKEDTGHTIGEATAGIVLGVATVLLYTGLFL